MKWFLMRSGLYPQHRASMDCTPYHTFNWYMVISKETFCCEKSCWDWLLGLETGRSNKENTSPPIECLRISAHTTDSDAVCSVLGDKALR